MNNLLKSLIISCAFLSVPCVASPELQEETSASRGLFQRCADEAWSMAKLFVGSLFDPFTPELVMEGLVEPNVAALERLTKAYPMTPSGAFRLCVDYPAEALDVVGALVFPPAKGAARHMRNLRAVYDMINAVPDDTQEWRVVKAATTLFTLTLLAQEFDFPAILPGAEAAELPDPKTATDARAFLGEGEPCPAELNDDLNCVLDAYTGLRAPDAPPCNPIEWLTTSYGIRFNNATGMPESLYGIQVFRQSFTPGSQTACVQSAYNLFAPVTEVCVTQGQVSVTPQDFTLEYASRYLMPGTDLLFVTGQNNAQQCGQIFPTRPAPLSHIGTMCVAAPSALVDGWPAEQTLVTCMDTLGHVDVRGLLPEEAAELGIDAATLVAAGGHKVMYDPHEMLDVLNMPTEDYSQEYPEYTAPLKASASGADTPSASPVFALRPDQCPLNGTRPVAPMTPARYLFPSVEHGEALLGAALQSAQNASSVFALRPDQCPLNGTTPVAPMTPARYLSSAVEHAHAPLGESQAFEDFSKGQTTALSEGRVAVEAPREGNTQGESVSAPSQDSNPESPAQIIASLLNGLGNKERSESFLATLEQLRKTIGDSEEYYRATGEAPGDFVQNLKDFVNLIQ